MTRNVRLVFWGAGALAVALAFAAGPLFAGYAIAGASLAVIVALMGSRVARAIGDWRLEHPRKHGHRHLPPDIHEGRHAA